jgi:hypothetical protein
VQLREARRLGLRHYQSPGGGCLLTDPVFSRKLRDLFDHDPAGRVGGEEVTLLTIGRHFRLGPDLKVVLGRDEAENGRLAGFEGPGRWQVAPHGFTGPSALVCGPHSEENLARAIALIARYARSPGAEDVVRWTAPEGPRERALGEAAESAGAAPPQLL